MPDSRSHRGAHPEDATDFAPLQAARLRAATRELSFLFEHGYAPDAALKLVGDHHQLTARQRKAVMRASAGSSAVTRRASTRRELRDLTAGKVFIDGFNCLISIEAMLSGAPLFRGADGALRDLASVHGTYRAVQESARAIDLVLTALTSCQIDATILLDKPVGNSGRTKQLIEQRALARGYELTVRLSDHVDRELSESAHAVASSDAWILDRAVAWVDLPAQVAREADLTVWLLDLA